jgi:hypothetical protein
MNRKKLELKIIDPVGNVVRSHHFHYEAGGNNKLVLTVGDRIFHLKPNGTLIVDAPKEQKPVKK